MDKQRITKEDIIIGLQCCGIWHHCSSCPFFNEGKSRCVDNLMIGALGLINGDREW